jgi:hypothetical protein
VCRLLSLALERRTWRVRVGPAVAWEMCHRELWEKYWSAAVIDASAVALMTNALEPIDDNSHFFRDMKRVIDTDSNDPSGGRCLWDTCNGTFDRAALVDQIFASGDSDANGTVWFPEVHSTSSNVAQLSDCWFNCALKSHLDTMARFALRSRELSKYDMLGAMRVYCPDARCAASIDAARRKVYVDASLPFVDAVRSATTYYS